MWSLTVMNWLANLLTKLTAQRSRTIPQKQIFAQLENTFPSCDISRNFVTLFTGDDHWPCGEAKCLSVQPNTSVISDLLSHLHLHILKCFFPLDIPVKSAIIYPCCYACYKTRLPGHLLFDHASDNLFGDQSLGFVITFTSTAFSYFVS